MRTAIVGAGAAGLSLALMLDGDVTVFEAEDTPGGLCRSTQRDGFTFDQGPHILGGIPESVTWIKETTGLEFVEGRTNNCAWIDGQFAPHPFTDESVAQQYMAKMWKHDPAELSLPGLGAQAGRKPGGVATFLYPKHGGYQAITDAWAAQLGDRLRLNERPPPRLPSKQECLVMTAAHPGRHYNTLVTVTLGYEGAGPGLTAIYIPGTETPFHRLSFPAAFSPENAPVGCFSVQGEVVASQPAADILDALCEVVSAVGISQRDFIFADWRVSPYAYPVPLHQDAWHPDAPRLWRHGRTGSHRYLNVDGVVAASMALAKQLNA